MQAIGEQLLQLNLSLVDSILVKSPGIDGIYLGFLSDRENGITNRFCRLGTSIVAEFGR